MPNSLLLIHTKPPKSNPHLTASTRECCVRCYPNPANITTLPVCFLTQKAFGLVMLDLPLQYYMFLRCSLAPTPHISPSTWDLQGEHQGHQAPLCLYLLSALSLPHLGDYSHKGRPHPLLVLWPKEPKVGKEEIPTLQGCVEGRRSQIPTIYPFISKWLKSLWGFCNKIKRNLKTPIPLNWVVLLVPPITTDDKA